MKRKRNQFPRETAGRFRERLLLLAALLLTSLLGAGLAVTSVSRARQTEQKDQLAILSFLGDLAQVADGSRRGDAWQVVLSCENARRTAEALPPDRMHGEVWQEALQAMQTAVRENALGKAAGRDLLCDAQAAAEEALGAGGDPRHALYLADGVLCGGIARLRQAEPETKKTAMRWIRPVVGVRNHRRMLAVRAEGFLGTADGMQEAVQSVDLSLHILYCQNAFVVFRARGDGYLQLVMYKPQRSAEGEVVFNLEDVCRQYHLVYTDLIETGRYAGGSVRGRIFSDRRGRTLHLASDRKYGNLAVLDAVW